ncbi:hypothetical protein Y1Q_0009515 [Alligator mississippiensis]|uniref:Uncharacterized protein n=1 Tax=Alligator mississippiensis TaxID=8496 RepID=A0A151NU71_ALLMI|nr:hypothetical protein Y1Q_0009515 [Alligator mississippiensis]
MTGPRGKIPGIHQRTLISSVNCISKFMVNPRLGAAETESSKRRTCRVVSALAVDVVRVRQTSSPIETCGLPGA